MLIIELKIIIFVHIFINLNLKKRKTIYLFKSLTLQYLRFIILTQSIIY